VAIPKKVLLEVGGFPPGEILAADLDTWLNIALRYPIAWSEEYYLYTIKKLRIGPLG